MPGYISKFSTAFYFNISTQIFCILFICFVYDGILWLIYFRIFCSKNLITFDNTYLISYRFHCIDIFHIKLRFCETLTVIKSVTRDLLIESLYKFITIKCWFARYLNIWFKLVWIQMFCIFRLVFLRLRPHWYFHGSN